jgi:predicted nuclease of restriction endonuclease-like RecB superfamily
LLLVASLIGRNQDAYLETLEESGRAVQGLADILTERITPVYRKYAAAEGLREEAFSGLTARTEEEINHAYLQAFQENARAVEGVASHLSDRILPVYERWATELGLGPETGRG